MISENTHLEYFLQCGRHSVGSSAAGELLRAGGPPRGVGGALRQLAVANDLLLHDEEDALGPLGGESAGSNSIFTVSESSLPHPRLCAAIAVLGGTGDVC